MLRPGSTERVMANEEFLLSGDQIATYGASQVTYPKEGPTIRLTNLRTLGSQESRYLLVRTQGEGEIVKNGQMFTVYEAIPTGKGGYVRGKEPLFKPNWATPDAYENTGAGDRYMVFGLFDGQRFAVNLDGFHGARNAVFVRGQDRVKGGDGELGISEIKAARPDTVICFAAGTPVETAAGEVAVERLAVGELVRTLDHGFRPIRWIGSARVDLGPGPHPARPVRIGAGALGPRVPVREILVSPAHRVLVAGSLCEMLTAAPEGLVPAQHLVGLPGVALAHELREVVYWHFAFDEHEIVFTAGLRSESLHPGRQALATVGADARRELMALFPALRTGEGGPPLAQGRGVLRAHEARVLAGLARRGPDAVRLG
jgi:hypothetical protein